VGITRILDRMLRRQADPVDVSVVIPCFNGEAYLRTCLRSVLTQSARPREVIVVDDGSTDKNASREICASFGTDLIKFVRKSNGGVSSALNAALEIAVGRTFCWLSVDDLFTPNRLKWQSNHWTRSGGEGKILFGDYLMFSSSEDQSWGGSLRSVIDVGAPSVWNLAFGHVHGCTTMLEVQSIRDAGYFNEDLRCTQDYDMWLSLIKKGYAFEYLDKYLVLSRIHDKQTSRWSQHAAAENRALWIRLVDAIYGLEVDSAQRPLVSDLEVIRSHIEGSEYLAQFDMETVIAHCDKMIQCARDHENSRGA
jgi:glycosyltransferase involved in cell wall biosynthesis